MIYKPEVDHLNKIKSIGTPEPKLVEHFWQAKKSYKRIQSLPRVEKQYSMQWRRKNLDLAELATKRFLEGWSQDDLCTHFGLGKETIKSAYLRLQRNDFRHKDIPEGLRKKLLKSPGSQKVRKND